MKKLLNYEALFYRENEDGTADEISTELSPSFMEAAVRAEKYIDELPLGKTQRKELYIHIRRLLDHAITDTFLQHLS